jgi:hypothetical protein
MKLLGAYHDGEIEIRYPEVFGYRIDAMSVQRGHGNWRYDEFRRSEEGHLIHEIEWRGWMSSSRWVIVALDIAYEWIPKQQGTPAL